MRIQYSIEKINKQYEVGLRVNGMSRSESVCMYCAEHGGSESAVFTITSPSIGGGRILRELSGLYADGRTPTITKIIDYINENAGRQVVYDERLRKFRNARTMRDDENVYEADGVNIQVSAESEEKGKRRLVTKITAIMVESPSRAAELAKWFAAGSPVKELESGAAPGMIDPSVLYPDGESPKRVVIRPKELDKPNVERKNRRGKRK